MQLNLLLTLALAALVPLIVGSVWYNPRVFGQSMIGQERMKGGTMALVFGLTYVFSFFLAFALSGIVIHQFGFSSMMQSPGGQPMTPAAHQAYLDVMRPYYANFRTWKHGAFHGILAGIAIALPLIGVNAMFERKGFKYIAIHVAFWTVCMALMGAIICHFGDTSMLLK